MQTLLCHSTVGTAPMGCGPSQALLGLAVAGLGSFGGALLRGCSPGPGGVLLMRWSNEMEERTMHMCMSLQAHHLATADDDRCMRPGAYHHTITHHMQVWHGG